MSYTSELLLIPSLHLLALLGRYLHSPRVSSSDSLSYCDDQQSQPGRGEGIREGHLNLTPGSWQPCDL